MVLGDQLTGARRTKVMKSLLDRDKHDGERKEGKHQRQPAISATATTATTGCI